MESHTQQGDHTNVCIEEDFFSEYWTFSTRDSRVIMWLIYACDPIPEEVLGLLYAAANTLRPFHKSMYLVSKFPRHLHSSFRYTIAPTSNWQYSINSVENNQTRVWWLSYGLKDYIEKNRSDQEEIRSLLDALVGNQETEVMESEPRSVANALCSLYLNINHPHEVVRNAATRAIAMWSLKDVNDDIDGIMDCRREAMEPIIWLLGLPVDNERHWTQSNINCARKVLLEYIFQNKLDWANVFILLRLDSFPSAQLATLEAIYHIDFIETECLLTEDCLSCFWEILSDILKLSDEAEGEIVTNSTQDVAFDVLVSTLHQFINTQNEQSIALAVNTPGILEALLNVIHEYSTAINSTERSIFFATKAMKTLHNLLCITWESTRLHILNKEGSIESLVKVLLNHGTIRLHKRAATILGDLAFGVELSDIQILKEYREGLFLFKRALEGLVSFLYAESNPCLQKRAALALRNLSSGEESIRVQVAKANGVLRGLVRCLSRDGDPDLQLNAAAALCNLSSKGQSERVQIAKDDGALPGLVRCLSRDGYPELQLNALGTLRNLSSGGHSIRVQVAKEDGALTGLVRAFSRDSSPELQRHATSCLWYLAAGRRLVKLKILKEEGAILGLVRLLSKHDNPALQENAAGTLAMLSVTAEPIVPRILKKGRELVGPGLERRVDTVHPTASLEYYASAAGGNLANYSESTIFQHLGEDGSCGPCHVAVEIKQS